MNMDFIAPVLTFSGSLIGTICSVFINTKMTNYRLKQLEKKVEEHNNFASRMPVVEEKIHTLNHRIDTFERSFEHEFH